MCFQRWREGNNLPSPGLAGEEAELIVLQVNIGPRKSRQVAQALTGVQPEQNQGRPCSRGLTRG